MSNLEDLIRKVLDAETTSLIELAKMVGLDPSKDFANSNLSNVNLEGEDLRDFNLTNADLSNANLRGADLSYADFSRSILNCADLQDTKLTATKFTYANLTGVQWDRADYSSARFYGSTGAPPPMQAAQEATESKPSMPPRSTSAEIEKKKERGRSIGQ